MNTRQAVAPVMASIFLISGCATMSNRTKTLLLMAGVGGIATAIGSQTAPEGTSPSGHAVFWGGLGAAAAGVAGLYVFDEQKRAEEAEKRAAELQATVNEFSRDRSLVGQYDIQGERPLPGALKDRIKTGVANWYRIDRWEDDGDTRSVHCDQEIELVPPRLRSGKTKAPGSVGSPSLAPPVAPGVGEDEMKAQSKQQSGSEMESPK